MTHDLSQPLTALTNFLTALQIALDQDAPRETLVALVATATSEATRARVAMSRLQDVIAS